MSDADGKYASEKIKVLLSIDIDDITPLSVVNNDRLLVVVCNGGEKVLLVFFNNLLFFHPVSRLNQVISNTGFESPCSTKGASCRFSPLDTPSALYPPQEAGFTLN